MDGLWIVGMIWFPRIIFKNYRLEKPSKKQTWYSKLSISMRWPPFSRQRIKNVLVFPNSNFNRCLSMGRSWSWSCQNYRRPMRWAKASYVEFWDTAPSSKLSPYRLKNWIPDSRGETCSTSSCSSSLQSKRNLRWSKLKNGALSQRARKVTWEMDWS